MGAGEPVEPDAEEESRRRCKCCGRRHQTSLEHAVPQWVSRGLPGSSREFQIQQGGDGASPRRWSSRGVAKIQVHICQACNSRMGALYEDWASILLAPLLCRGDTSHEYDTLDQVQLARWSFKTAAMIDLASVSDPVIPVEHRGHFIETNQLPPRTFIWVGRSGHTPNGAESQHWQGTVAYADDELTSYVITAWLGYFAFQIFGILSGPGRQVARRSVHLFPVWPPLERPLTWRADEFPELTESAFAAAHNDFFSQTVLRAKPE